MKMIFLGLMFVDSMLECVLKESKTPVQMATHVFQKNMTGGLKNIADVALYSICVPPIGSYPLHYKRLFIKENKHENGLQIGYINLPYVKHMMQVKKIYKHVKTMIENGKCDSLMIYSLYPPFMVVANKIKRLFPECKVCLIQTDAVPGRNDAEKYMTKHNIKKGNWLVKQAKCCDSFVLLTKYLADPLEVGTREYTIVECICDSEQPECAVNQVSQNICLYTGVLDRIYNVKNMVRAFENIPNAELWLCGAGDAVEEIQNACATHPNIKYYGYVSHEKLQDYRNKCDFLINPRVPEGNYTLYSFPSKTAEYMMSGKPAIMYKLEGIPDEYDNYLNYLTKATAEGMAEELKTIFETDYACLVSKAKKARQFMLDNKNEKMQAERIVKSLMHE